MRYFFVGGAPKSGTTWMQKAIDAHPEAVCSGEGHFHGKIVKPMLDMFGAYNESVASINRDVYGDRPYHVPLTMAEMVVAIRQTLVTLMSRRVRPETIAVGDKTPSYAVQIRDLNAIFPGMHFVQMVRDPRDVTTSRLHHIRRVSGRAVLDCASDAYREAVQQGAEFWAEADKRCRTFAVDHPDHILTVRYEDFIDTPALVLARVFAFLGLSTEPSQVTMIAQQSSFEAFSGRKSGSEDVESFFRKGIKGDWPNWLDSWAVETVAQICRQGMAQFGYS